MIRAPGIAWTHAPCPPTNPSAFHWRPSGPRKGVNSDRLTLCRPFLPDRGPDPSQGMVIYSRVRPPHSHVENPTNFSLDLYVSWHIHHPAHRRICRFKFVRTHLLGSVLVLFPFYSGHHLRRSIHSKAGSASRRLSPGSARIGCWLGRCRFYHLPRSHQSFSSIRTLDRERFALNVRNIFIFSQHCLQE